MAHSLRAVGYDVEDVAATADEASRRLDIQFYGWLLPTGGCQIATASSLLGGPARRQDPDRQRLPVRAVACINGPARSHDEARPRQGLAGTQAVG